VVVTPCGSCKTRLERDLDVPVVHPLQLLARSMGIGDEGPGNGDR